MDGQGRRAEEEIVAAIDGLEQLPPSPELALAYNYHAQVRRLMPDYVTAIAQARRAIEVADQIGSVDSSLFVAVRQAQGIATYPQICRNWVLRRAAHRAQCPA